MNKSVAGTFVALVIVQVACAQEVQGRLEIKRFDQSGNVRNITEGTYKTFASSGEYYIKALIPHQYNDAGVIIHSNYNEVYQSQVVYPERDASLATHTKMPRLGYAVIERGAIPNGYETFSVVQALALVQALINKRDAAVVDGGLNDQYIPRVIHRRAREDRVTKVRSSVGYQEEALSELKNINVRFEASDSDKKPYAKLGDIEAVYTKNGTLVRAVFGLYSTLSGGPVSVATFQTDEQFDQVSNELYTIAYEPELPVSVQDKRFDLVEPLSYTLRPGEMVPLASEGNQSYQKVLVLANEMASVADRINTRRMQIRMLIGATIAFFLGAIIWRLLKQQKKHHEIRQ